MANLPSQSPGYLVEGKVVKVTRHEIEIWRTFFGLGNPRLTCRTPLATAQVNPYYRRYFRTSCGNFGVADLGMGVVALSHALGMPRLDWNEGNEIRRTADQIIGDLFIANGTGALVRTGSGLVYPFSAVTLGEDGVLTGSLRGQTIAVIPAEQRDAVREMLSEN